MHRTITGHCPETGDERTITVKVERISLGGGYPTSDKVLGYSCRYAQEHGCHHNGDGGRTCPLLRQIS